MLAFVLMDQTCHYFVSSCSSLAKGTPYIWTHWQQVNEATDADADRVELTVTQPKAAELYFTTCSLIDCNNWHKQDTLQLERKLETTNWATWVGTSLLRICIV